MIPRISDIMGFESKFFLMVFTQGLGFTISSVALIQDIRNPQLVSIETIWVPLTVVIGSIGAIVYSTIRVTRFVDRIISHLEEVEKRKEGE